MTEFCISLIVTDQFSIVAKTGPTQTRTRWAMGYGFPQLHLKRESFPLLHIPRNTCCWPVLSSGPSVTTTLPLSATVAINYHIAYRDPLIRWATLSPAIKHWMGSWKKRLGSCSSGRMGLVGSNQITKWCCSSNQCSRCNIKIGMSKWLSKVSENWLSNAPLVNTKIKMTQQIHCDDLKWLLQPFRRLLL